MKKAILSQPMNGIKEEDIIQTRDRAIKWLHENGYEVVNTLFTDEWYKPENMEKRGVVNVPLCFLAKSIENMSKVDTVFFCRGWQNARGCQAEHFVAKSYGLHVLYEEG